MPVAPTRPRHERRERSRREPVAVRTCDLIATGSDRLRANDGRSVAACQEEVERRTPLAPHQLPDGSHHRGPGRRRRGEDHRGVGGARASQVGRLIQLGEQERERAGRPAFSAAGAVEPRRNVWLNRDGEEQDVEADLGAEHDRAWPRQLAGQIEPADVAALPPHVDARVKDAD